MPDRVTPRRLSIARAILLATVVSIGLWIRVAGLHQSLWLDESRVWSVESSFVTMLHRVPAVIGQSPFYYALVWLSVHVFGESEWALRLPSLASGILATVAVVAAGQAIEGDASAWAGVLFWLSYPSAWESVDARPYALAMAAAALATTGFIAACRLASARNRLTWAAGAAGVVWAHYLFVPFLLGLVVAYGLHAGLRAVYKPRMFALDLRSCGACHGSNVAPVSCHGVQRWIPGMGIRAQIHRCARPSGAVCAGDDHAAASGCG